MKLIRAVPLRILLYSCVFFRFRFRFTECSLPERRLPDRRFIESVVGGRNRGKAVIGPI